MDLQNTLQVQPLSVSFAAAPSLQIATAMPLSVLQQAIVTVSGGGPTFAAANEPVQDGVAYLATDGVSYYRPLFRVANRAPGLRPGPDVWFLQDDNGDVSFQWTLEVVPMPGATPLPITISAVRLLADPGYVLDFPAPGLDPVEGAATDAAPFLVHAGLPLRHDQANQLETMLNNSAPAARLELSYNYSYTVEVAQPTPTGPILVPRHPIGEVRDHRGGVTFKPGTLGGLGGLGGRFNPSTTFESFAATAAFSAASVEPTAMFAVDQPVFTISRKVRPAWRDVLLNGEITAVINGQQTRPESRAQTVVRTVPFVFEPSKEENGPIYRALHDAANLTGQWALLGDAGWLRDSDFPNTVFRLPDAVRLAWDAETAGPRMVPTLYRNTAGDPRVRLLLALAPYQDPAKLVLTRAGAHLPAARIVVGGVDGGTLHMGGAFPEELTVVGGTEGVPIALGAGAELVLDVSLAFYQFFCTMVARPEGINGQVRVNVGTLPAVDGQPPQPRVVPIPVAIRLDRVNDLPCAISVAPDVAAPQKVTVTNTSGCELSLGGCAGTFLQVDPDSVVPVDSYPARCTSSFPVIIPAGGSVDIQFELETPAADLIWNGILVELLDKKLTEAPDAILKHVHEMAAAGDVGRQLTVSSPVFQADTLPAQWSSLVSIEVQLTVAGTAPVSVVLSKANPSRTVSLPMSLQDLVQSTPGGVTTVKYQVRNNYVDHQGNWTDPREQTGTDLVAYPHPADGD